MIEHIYQNIQGYFTYPDFYRWVARQRYDANPSSDTWDWHGVEVGVYTGQSAAFLAVELAQYRCRGNTTLDLVDCQMATLGTKENLAPLARLNVIGKFHEMYSYQAAEKYKDKSLDFVFIDAAHDYTSVRKDIDSWKPKIRPGGILAGHDYCEWPGFGIIQAVTETFERVEVWRGDKWSGDQPPRYWPCWCVRIP